MSKTIYASKRKLKAMGISLDGYPSAGPHPSITGMKKLYWGIDTYDDIHKAFIDAMDRLLSDEEENKEG